MKLSFVLFPILLSYKIAGYKKNANFVAYSPIVQKPYKLVFANTVLRGWLGDTDRSGLCLGPRFIVPSEGLGLWEMEFAHVLTPGERPSSTEIRACNQT